jgi:hypothetical protein
MRRQGNLAPSWARKLLIGQVDRLAGLDDSGQAALAGVTCANCWHLYLYVGLTSLSSVFGFIGPIGIPISRLWGQPFTYTDQAIH